MRKQEFLKYINYSILILFITCLSVTISNGQTTDISKFDWLIGKWQGDFRKGTFTEKWTLVNDQLMLGEGYYIVDGDTLMTEVLRIEKFENFWGYVPIINDNPPTLFVMSKSANDEVTFENKEHDFPQRIIYKLIDKLNLRATIEGEINGEISKEDTFMKKVR